MLISIEARSRWGIILINFRLLAFMLASYVFHDWTKIRDDSAI